MEPAGVSPSGGASAAPDPRTRPVESVRPGCLVPCPSPADVRVPLPH
jgi:hypothetical protein